MTNPPLSPLDTRMRLLLMDLALCCHVPAVNPQGGSASSDEHPGGARPPGDLGAEAYARRYGPPFHTCTTRCRHDGPARDDEDRRHLISAVRAEIETIRGYGLASIPRPAGETADEFNARIVAVGEGWPVRDAANHFKTTSTRVIRARRAANCEPEFGKPLPDKPAHTRTSNGRFGGHLDAETRRERVHDLKGQGMGPSRIALALGISKSTVERDLGMRAA